MKKSLGEKIFSVFNIVLLTLIGFICLLPMWHILMASVSDPIAVAKSHQMILYPLETIQFKAYEMVLNYKGVWNGYRNTIFYVIAQCLITGFFSVIGGYALSRRSFRYRNVFMLFMLFTMLFNGGMIPTYMVIRKIGILDSVWAMLLPGAISAFNILIMRTAMVSIPESLEESAKLDGAGDTTIMFRILFPLVKSSFAVVILFTAVSKWNDYFTAMIYLPTRQDLYPLQMFMRNILNSAATVTSSADAITTSATYAKLVEYALIIVSTLPILCIYPFVQKYFIQGVMIGSVKQ